jgi:Cu/Ag efflux pump CusA
MINWLIEFSLKNRFLILLVYALLAGWGYWALLGPRSTPFLISVKTG